MAINLELWKQKRKALKLDYQTLAEKAGVSLNTIKNIFRGATTDPRIETVQRIEEVLGLSQEEEPEYTDDEKELFDLIMQLTDEEAQEMWHFLEYLISKRQKK